MTAARSLFCLRSDQPEDDWLTRQRFETYEEAYDVLERYYADLCCSDDRVYYRIEPADDPG